MAIKNDIVVLLYLIKIAHVINTIISKIDLNNVDINVYLLFSFVSIIDLSNNFRIIFLISFFSVFVIPKVFISLKPLIDSFVIDV
jgi:hypothetical protein